MHKLFLLLFLSFIFSSCTKKIKDDFLLGVKFNPNEIEITGFYEEKKNNAVADHLHLANDKNEKLKIISKKIKSADAKKYILQKSNEIKLLFTPQQVPYFGQITKDIKCTDSVEVDKNIIETENDLSLQINLTATEFFIYGTCITDQEIYKSQLLYLYCKKSETLHEIKYFYDRSEKYKNKIAECY